MTRLLLFDISGGELMLILLFVLLFFGSKGIPDMARTLGKGMRQLRDATNEVQREIQKGASDVKRGFDEQKRAIELEPPANSLPQGTPPGVPPPSEPSEPSEPA